MNKERRLGRGLEALLGRPLDRPNESLEIHREPADEPQDGLLVNIVAPRGGVGGRIPVRRSDQLDVGGRKPAGAGIGQPGSHGICIDLRSLQICRRRVAQIRIAGNADDDGIVVGVHRDQRG